MGIHQLLSLTTMVVDVASPLPKDKNPLGMLWFCGSITVMAITSFLYIYNIMPWYYAMTLMAVAVSIMHELEHDLIHDMYFKDSKFIQHFMFAVIWVSKLNANPWWRKPMHLKHHKTSGQVDDIEERLIGLGMPLGLKRLFITISPLGAFLVMGQVAKDSAALKSELLLPSHLALLAILFPSFVPVGIYTLCWNVTMLLFLPNMLRQSCLQLVSTGRHYYGDIPEKNVFFQNQVIGHWVFYPFQLFCFNFGATHIIHHYVSRQPFYLRQMCAPEVANELQKQGVRFNDFEIYLRDHRYYTKQTEDKPASLMIGA